MSIAANVFSEAAENQALMKTTIKSLLLLLLLVSPSLADRSTPDGAVNEFYQWYQQSSFEYRKKFTEAAPYFTEELYGLLRDGFGQSPESDFWVDFDPFVNAQMDAQAISVGKPSSKGPGVAVVPVTPTYGRGGASNYEGDPIKVWVKQVGGEWKIANLVYTGDFPFELKKYLKEGLGR